MLCLTRSIIVHGMNVKRLLSVVSRFCAFGAVGWTSQNNLLSSIKLRGRCASLSAFSILFQMQDMECRVQEANERATEAEEKV